jgi:uncharacterized protein YigA (DUF484 family)
MSEAGQGLKPPKDLSKASEASAGWPSVRSFIVSHPHLVRDDADLLSVLGLRFDAANVIEFGPTALARHIDAHRRESTARQEVEAAARANYHAQTQSQAGVIDLLESRNNTDLARRVGEVARQRFGLMAGGLAVEGPAPAGWVSLDEGMADMILGGHAWTRLGETGFGMLLFPELAEEAGSCGIIRLALWGRMGLLSFASPDPEGFTPDMGVELISFLARVVERTAERWPPA